MKVSELSNEAFQKTFPIHLLPYNPAYAAWYETEKARILRVVKAEDVVRVNHIGSTAVEGLVAKPMIDILLEIDGRCHVTSLVDSLKTIGYGEAIFTQKDDPLRLLLGKGFTIDGYAERVFMLHVRYHGDWDELYFRDYLIEHPDAAREYGELKLKILRDIEAGVIERMPNGVPNGYSQAKLAFVQEITRLAKQAYCDRYRPGNLLEIGNTREG